MDRNALWHGGEGRSISESVRWALETTFDLQFGEKQIRKIEKPKPQWRRPTTGTPKINVYACFLQRDA
jgi:hypothetical protein